MATVTQPAPAGHNADAALIADLSRWYTMRADLAKLQAEEVALRRDLYARAFPDAGEKGTSRRSLGDGKDLKGVAKLSYTVDRDQLNAALGTADAQVEQGNLALKEALDRVVRYKPEVSESELLRVTDGKVKRVLATFITSKPGLPGLEIVDAKKGA